MSRENKFNNSNFGEQIYKWCCDLFPINRSITGPGVRATLEYLKSEIPNLKIRNVKSKTKVFDWWVPLEWKVNKAYIKDPDGNKFIDFSDNNLHLVGYSTPFVGRMELNELNDHLHSIEKQPDAIPYVTSYYNETWGFCIKHNQRCKLKRGIYEVVVDTEIYPGYLNYGEVLIKGESKKEIFLSTYICHPSMANNELSGPTVTTAIVKWLNTLKNKKYSYRIVFIPETIGSITYISRNLEQLKKNVYAGFNITCIGDNLCYSYLPSRSEDSISDIVALHVLKHIDREFRKYPWHERGSDERQYCAPGIDLPIATIMRSKYAEYPEYHTSLDNLDFISPEGLYGGFTAIKRAIEILERNSKYIVTNLCEPNLGRRGLYPTLSTKESNDKIKDLTTILSYCDGEKTILEIAEKINLSFFDVEKIINKLQESDLIREL